MLKLGSLFDGLGGWLMAAVHSGAVVPVWASEVDDFPAAVTALRFPNVQQLGDITKINGAAIEPVDIITAGSPCQNLSIAGNRKGLAGDQSSLFMEAMRIVNEMREATDGKYPRFFVWENVPGAFTSNKGMDFKSVLEEIGATEVPMPDRWAYAGLVQCDRCEIAWRVLDAQYWGVPQRRKRIFLVADFAAANRCAGEILFECEGVPGDSSKGKGTQCNSPASVENCVGSSMFVKKNFTSYNEAPVAGTLRSSGGDLGGAARTSCVIGPLAARDYKGVGNQYVQEGKVIVQH